MGKACVAVELLLEQDETKAKKIAEDLDMLNSKRQQVEKEIFEQALEKIKKEDMIIYENTWC